MASTFTSRIRLNKQMMEIIQQWGVVLNDGVISLVDDAIAAYTTISIGSAATVTLSAVNGAGDTASAFLEVKGSVGGLTTITLEIPSNSKVIN